MIMGFTRLLLILLLCALACLEKADGFTLQMPASSRSQKGEHRRPVRNLVTTATVDNTIQISSRIRWKTTLPFKPDDSIELYGDKDDEEEEEEESLPEKEEPDLGLMATFLANRLARAYIKTKLQNVGSEQSTNVQESTTATIVEDAKDTTAEVGDSEGKDVEESKPIILPPVVDAKDSATTTTITETPTDPAVKSEKVARELLARREAEKPVVTEGKPQSEAPAEVKVADKEVKPAASEETADEEDTKADVETTEVPSLMHEKEGDRNIALKDDFVEVTDGEGELWSGIAAIPPEISLDFGRPLQVVKDGIPPLRS